MTLRSRCAWPWASALLLLVTGLFPWLTDALRPMGSDYQPIKLTKILDQLQLLLFATLTYVLLARRGLGLPASGRRTLLDSEWFYRLIPALARRGAGLLDDASDAIGRVTRITERHPGNGRVANSLAKGWPTGSMAFWTMVLLVALLFAGIWRS